MRTIDLPSWEREPHYRFYRAYERPWFNVCAAVDVTGLTAACGSPDGPSFFLASLWLSLGAANDTESFRYRIRGDDVVVHEVVHGGSTILREDETFGFGYFDWEPDFDRFAEAASAEVERVRRSSGALDPRDDVDDLIHYSILPWIAFTSFTHARRQWTDDAVPKIVFGRRQRSEGRDRMPVSVEVHHAVVDGLHVGRFLERFQERLDTLPPAWGGPAAG